MSLPKASVQVELGLVQETGRQLLAEQFLCDAK
jgi:hypothetical protein